jgi:hypothetical protein
MSKYRSEMEQVAGSCECGGEPPGSINVGNFLTSFRSISFSRRAQLHGVRALVGSCYR